MANVLAIGAHYDDVELGCGGVVQWHVENGDTVVYLIVPDGRRAGGSSVRRAEQISAQKYLDVHDLVTLDQPTGSLRSSNESVLLDKVRRVIFEKDIDTVYAHYDGDVHGDHVAVSWIARVLAKDVHRVLMYETPSTSNFTPSVYMPLREHELEKKLAAICLHESQIIRLSTGMRLDVWARIVAMYRGMEIRREYAEGFVPVRYIMEDLSMEENGEGNVD